MKCKIFTLYQVRKIICGRFYLAKYLSVKIEIGCLLIGWQGSIVSVHAKKKH